MDAAKAESTLARSEPLPDDDRTGYARPVSQFEEVESSAKEAMWNHMKTKYSKMHPKTPEERRRNEEGGTVLSLLSGGGAMAESCKGASLV
jgi:hypothetical protein